MSNKIKMNDLALELLAMRGCSAVSIVSKTEPRFRKKLDGVANPFIGEVVKVSHVNGMINWKYENAVNNQRMREETALNEDGSVEHFEAKPRQWGSRMTRADGTVTPLVEHKGNYYLEMKVEKSLGHEYRDSEGNKIARETIEPWLLAQSKSSRQKTEKEIIVRDYKLASIDEIRINGKTLKVVD